MPQTTSQEAWTSNPELVRRFMEVRPQYEALCSEVAYILRKRIDEAGVEVSAVTCRAKTLNSFLKKLERKPYKAPLNDVTDLAGARVVCLYRDDIAAVEKIISDEFEVIQRVDKLAEKQPDEFGYGALHFVVRLGKRSSGARYDDLKGLACEIQVRTVLQDAWAIVEHHLVYKSKSNVPSTIRRKLSRVSALFEDADERFQEIRKERAAYVDTVRDSISQPDKFLATELNLDSFQEYLLWKLADRPVQIGENQLSYNLKVLETAGCKTLSDIDHALDKGLLDRALAVEAEGPEPYFNDNGRFPSSFLVALAVALANKAAMEVLLEGNDSEFGRMERQALWSTSTE